MENLINRTQDLHPDKEMVDPETDRRYIIDCAIRTGCQGAPFEESEVDAALKYLWETEQEGNVHRWYNEDNAQVMMEQIRESAKEAISRDEIEGGHEADAQLADELREQTGKSVEEAMEDLKKMLGVSHELCDNILKIRQWLDEGTDVLMNEYVKEDPIKKAEVIVGLSTISGFLSDYFSIMEVIMSEQDDEEDGENDDEDGEQVDRDEPQLPRKKLNPRGPGKKPEQSEPVIDFNAAPSTNFFAAPADGKPAGFGFGSSNAAEYDIVEDQEDQEDDEDEEGGEDDGYFRDGDFDDTEELAQLCFTMAQVASDDPVFMKTIEISLSVTSLILKDFEEWTGVEFGDVDEGCCDHDHEEDEDCPELVDIQ